MWLHNAIVPTGSTKKLTSFWRGRYTVIDKINYCIQLIGGSQQLVVQVNRLKQCHTEPPTKPEPVNIPTLPGVGISSCCRWVSDTLQTPTQLEPQVYTSHTSEHVSGMLQSYIQTLLSVPESPLPTPIVTETRPSRIRNQRPSVCNMTYSW